MSEVQQQVEGVRNALREAQRRLVAAEAKEERHELACEVGRLAAQLGRVQLLRSRGLSEPSGSERCADVDQ